MWTFNEIEYSTPPVDCIGFVYIITEKDSGLKYIGKKLFWHKKLKKKVESDWKTYYGSSEKLKARYAELGPDGYTRQIIRLCKSKGEMSYFEAKEQIERKVLLDPSYYNGIINCRVNAKHLKGITLEDI